MGFAFLSLAFVNLAYVFAYTTLEPLGAYHRFATVMGVKIAFACFHLFMHNYGKLTFPKEYKVLKIVLVGLIGFDILYFALYDSVQWQRYFDFTSGGYTFFAGNLAGIFIFVFLVYLIVVGVRKAKRLEGVEKKAAYQLVFAIIFISLTPGITNVLSINGILTREIHQNIWTTFSIVGWFLILLIYINHTIDQTSFMLKIVSISIVVILLMVQALSMFIMNRYDRLYDDKAIGNFTGLFEEKGKHKHQYLVRISDTKSEFLFLFQVHGGFYKIRGVIIGNQRLIDE